jgi:hypothetical protein
MRIKVYHNYGGWATNDRRIFPGIYDIDDDALFGVGEYLVTNGHAEVVEEPEPELPAPTPPLKRKRGRPRKTKRTQT